MSTKHKNNTRGDEKGGGTSTLPNSISSNNKSTATATRRGSFDVEATSRRISVCAINYINTISDRRIQDPNKISDEEMDPVVHDVLQEYTDEDGNVDAKQIIRDSLRSNLEKIKQQVLNSELMKTVSKLI